MWGNSVMIFLIRFFPSLATLLVIIVYSRSLSQDVYGTYQLFWVRLYLLSSVALIGVPAVLLTYSQSFIRQLLSLLRANHYLYMSIWLVLISAVFAWICGNGGMSFYVAFLFFLVYTVNAFAEAVLIVTKKYTLLLTVNTAYAIAFLWLHNSLLIRNYSLEQLFTYLLVLGAARLFITLFRAIITLRKIEPTHDERYTMADIRSLWKHIGIYDILQKSITWVDKFFIGLLFTSATAAVYFNATYDIPFLPLLLGAVSGAALMQMSSFTKSNTDAATQIISQQTGRILSSIALPLFFFLFYYRHELFTVVLTEQYEASVPVFTAALFIVPLRSYSFTSILQNRHKGRIINTGALIDYIVAFALIYPLFLLMGLPGIALSFVISTYIQSSYYLYYTSTVLNTTIAELLPIRNWVVKLLVYAVLFGLAYYCSAMLISETFVLISGIVLMIFTATISLLVEFRTIKKQYGESVSQK